MTEFDAQTETSIDDDGYYNEADAQPASDAIIILQIDDPANYLDPAQRADLSRRLVRLMGAENFHVGRISPTGNSPVRQAFDEVEPISRQLAHEIDMPGMEGKQVWVGNYRMHNPRNPKAQCILINVKGRQYAGRETPTEDWPFLAMIYDWLKANYVQGKMIIGVDMPEMPFLEMSDAIRDGIHEEYLRAGPADIIRNVAGEIVMQNETWRLDREHKEHYHCAACNDIMSFRGPHMRIDEIQNPDTGYVSSTATDTGGERHECRTCGERAVVYKDEFGHPLAHWMGASGCRRMAGEIRLASPEYFNRSLDTSAQVTLPSGEVQVLTDWTEDVRRVSSVMSGLLH